MDDLEYAAKAFEVLDFVPTGICVLRSDFVVVFWNSCLESWTSAPKKSVVGQDVRVLFEHLRQPKFTERLKMIFEGGPPTIFSSYLHKYFIPAQLPNGEFRYQSTTVTAVPSHNGWAYYALASIEDVTDLTRRIRDYRAMRDQAEADATRRKLTEDALQKAQSRLEDQIGKTTIQLVQANQSLQQSEVERQQTESELKRTLAQHEHVLSSISCLLIGVDAWGTIVRWNVVAERLFGISRETALTRSFPESGISWDQGVVSRNIMPCLNTPESSRLEDIAFTRVDGTEGTLSLVVNPIQDPAGRPQGFLLAGIESTPGTAP